MDKYGNRKNHLLLIQLSTIVVDDDGVGGGDGDGDVDGSVGGDGNDDGESDGDDDGGGGILIQSADIY